MVAMSSWLSQSAVQVLRWYVLGSAETQPLCMSVKGSSLVIQIGGSPRRSVQLLGSESLLSVSCFCVLGCKVSLWQCSEWIHLLGSALLIFCMASGLHSWNSGVHAAVPSVVVTILSDWGRARVLATSVNQPGPKDTRAKVFVEVILCQWAYTYARVSPHKQFVLLVWCRNQNAISLTCKFFDTQSSGRSA